MQTRYFVFLFALFSCCLASAQLPVLRLTGDNLSASFSDGTFQLDGGEVMKADLRWRGASALTYEKKSFAIKLKGADGEKLDTALLGMRRDNSWILDAMAVDVARMRNRVSMDLWNDFASKAYITEKNPDAFNGTHGKFVEVFVNDEYEGLYCLTEKVDRKQLKLKKHQDGVVKGVLYKVAQYSSLYSEDESFYLYDNSVPKWHGFELAYPDIDDDEPIDWEPLSETIHWLNFSSPEEIRENIENKIDVPVWLDYILMVDLIRADDNVAKNMYLYFYNSTKESRMLGMTPWDMDNSWGRSIRAEKQDAEYEMNISNWINYHLYYTYCDEEGSMYRDRYAELRETFFVPDVLKKYFDTYFDLFKETGVDKREVERWKSVRGNDLDFDAEREFIHDWIDRRIAFLDVQYNYGVDDGIVDRDFVLKSSSVVNVFNINGALVKTVRRAELPSLVLPKGIYIIDGRKVRF